MQIAVITDIHGNTQALEAALLDIRHKQVDHLVCAGDIVNPLQTSPEVLRTLQTRQIPCLRGNHEDYMLAYHQKSREDILHSIQFMPTRLCAETLNTSDLAYLAGLPMTLSLPHPSGKNVLICHAQPSANNKGYFREISPALALELQACSESVIICGHWHHVGQQVWQDKLLITAGSLGQSFNAEGTAEYSLLQFYAGEWHHHPQTVEYDRKATSAGYLDSGFFHRGGPIAWLLLDEIMHAQGRIAAFFRWLPSTGRHPQNLGEWQQVCQIFLQDRGSWTKIKNYL